VPKELDAGGRTDSLDLREYDRTITYLIWRACERWGWSPFDWPGLPQERRDQVLAYEQVRMREDVMLHGLLAGAQQARPTP
jgi:hypothetical protein